MPGRTRRRILSTFSGVIVAVLTTIAAVVALPISAIGIAGILVATMIGGGCIGLLIAGECCDGEDEAAYRAAHDDTITRA